MCYRRHTNIFIRTKIFNRPILAYALIDSGNLSQTLISEQLYKKLKLPLLPTNIVLRSPNKSAINVLGAVPSFKIWLENIERAIEIEPLVIKDLTYPINLGQAFLSRYQATLDFSRPPGLFQINGQNTPLVSNKTPLMKPSLDIRFRKVQEAMQTRTKGLMVMDHYICSLNQLNPAESTVTQNNPETAPREEEVECSNLEPDARAQTTTNLEPDALTHHATQPKQPACKPDIPKPFKPSGDPHRPVCLEFYAQKINVYTESGQPIAARSARHVTIKIPANFKHVRDSETFHFTCK